MQGKSIADDIKEKENERATQRKINLERWSALYEYKTTDNLLEVLKMQEKPKIIDTTLTHNFSVPLFGPPIIAYTHQSHIHETYYSIKHGNYIFYIRSERYNCNNSERTYYMDISRIDETGVVTKLKSTEGSLEKIKKRLDNYVNPKVPACACVIM